MCCVRSFHVTQHHVPHGQRRGVLAHGQQSILARPRGVLPYLPGILPYVPGLFPHVPGLLAYLPRLLTYLSWIQPNKPGLFANLSRCASVHLALVLSSGCYPCAPLAPVLGASYPSGLSCLFIDASGCIPHSCYEPALDKVTAFCQRLAIFDAVPGLVRAAWVG